MAQPLTGQHGSTRGCPPPGPVRATVRQRKEKRGGWEVTAGVRPARRVWFLLDASKEFSSPAFHFLTPAFDGIGFRTSLAFGISVTPASGAGATLRASRSARSRSANAARSSVVVLVFVFSVSMMGFLSGLCDGVIFEARPLRLLYNLAGF